MDAIVLAGGLGTRLREVVADVPKPLASVAGRPFLDILLGQLKSVPDLRRVTLAVGYKAEAIVDYYHTHAPSGAYDLHFSLEDIPLGTGGALSKATARGVSNPFLVLNGDSYLEMPWQRFLEWHRQHGATATIAAVHQSDVSRFGEVVLAADGVHVERFREKHAVSGTGLINGGIYLFQHRVLDCFPSQQTFSLETEVFPKLVQCGMVAYPVAGRFIDIGTADSYRDAQTVLNGV